MSAVHFTTKGYQQSTRPEDQAIIQSWKGYLLKEQKYEVLFAWISVCEQNTHRKLLRISVWSPPSPSAYDSSQMNEA